MLVLSRHVGQEIVIPELDIRILLLEIRGNKSRIAIECPKKYAVHRKEVFDLIQAKDAERNREVSNG